MLLIDYLQLQLPLVLSQEYLTDRMKMLNQMINNIFRHAPTDISTQNSEYYSAHYRSQYEREHENTLLMTWLVEKMTYSISSVSLDSKPGLSFWGALPQNEEQAKKIYLLHHALHFKTTGLGNCSYRASYSAIELAKIFISTNAGVEIKVRSYPEIDQFVVIMGGDTTGWKIYDPLTNPELIFDYQEYTELVKPLFKSVITPKRPYEFTLSRSEINRYDCLAKKMIHLLKTEADNLLIESLPMDSNYHSFLQSKGIVDPTFKKTNAAIQQLLAIIHENTPMNHTHKI